MRQQQMINGGIEKEFENGICPVTDEMLERTYLDLPAAERAEKIRIRQVVDERIEQYLNAL